MNTLAPRSRRVCDPGSPWWKSYKVLCKTNIVAYNCFMAVGRRNRRQRRKGLWVAAAELPKTTAHPFYRGLNELLDEHGFDDLAERRCENPDAKIAQVKDGRALGARGRAHRGRGDGRAAGADRVGRRSRRHGNVGRDDHRGSEASRRGRPRPAGEREPVSARE